jgi:hypothetical protein
MHRSSLSGLAAAAVALAGVSYALAESSCRPTLAFKHVAFSPMQPPTMQRKWTALVSVDASRCVAGSTGHFEIAFTRLQEFGPDTEAHEEFTWAAPEVTVAINFAPSEAVEHYRIGAITPCPCAGKLRASLRRPFGLRDLPPG